jgi:hypothetical protein
MALTFKTAELIKVCEDAIGRQVNAAAAHEKAKAAAREKHRAKWEADNMPRVRTLRDYLSKCLKNGTPPLSFEACNIMGVADGYRRAIAFFEEGGDGGIYAPRGTYINAERWRSLVAILKAHQLDTITAHQVKELGYHPKDLERLFADALTMGAAVKSSK